MDVNNVVLFTEKQDLCNTAAMLSSRTHCPIHILSSGLPLLMPSLLSLSKLTYSPVAHTNLNPHHSVEHVVQDAQYGKTADCRSIFSIVTLLLFSLLFFFLSPQVLSQNGKWQLLIHTIILNPILLSHNCRIYPFSS